MLTQSLSNCQGPLAHCSVTCCDYIVRSILNLHAVTAGGKDLDRKSVRSLAPHATIGSVPLRSEERLVPQRWQTGVTHKTLGCFSKSSATGTT